MSEYAEVRPVPGRLVFRPENGRPLSPNGERVELTPFWRRRLNDGDVEAVQPPQSAPVSGDAQPVEASNAPEETPVPEPAENEEDI